MLTVYNRHLTWWVYASCTLYEEPEYTSYWMRFIKPTRWCRLLAQKQFELTHLYDSRKVAKGERMRERWSIFTITKIQNKLTCNYWHFPTTATKDINLQEKSIVITNEDTRILSQTMDSNAYKFQIQATHSLKQYTE